MMTSVFFLDRWCPFLKDLRGYSLRPARQDLQAGLTVAVFAVPQVMAYAILAGVPAVHGLYAAVFASIVAALWGSSPYLNTGPTNSAALLVMAALAAYRGEAEPVAILGLLTLMVGLIRCFAGIIQSGSLANYIPSSALLGFTAGVGVLIALGQVHHILGVKVSNTEWLVFRMAEAFGQIRKTHLSTLLIGLGSLAIMLSCNRYARRWPVALGAITLASVSAWLLGPDSGIWLVRDLGSIPRGLPGPSFPLVDMQLMADLLPTAFSIAVIGLIEATAIAQSLAAKHGQRIDFNQECIGQGFSQVVASFFQGLPGSGSFSRSALIQQAGGATRMANVYFGAVIAGMLMLIPGLLGMIPVTALAGLLLFIGISLVDGKKIRDVFRISREEGLILALTFVVTVFVQVNYGVFVGIIISSLNVLKQAGDLQMNELLPQSERRFREIPLDTGDGRSSSDLVAVGLYGDLFYGVAAELRRRLGDLVKDRHPKHLILRMRRVRSIDYSCWDVIFQLADLLQKQGGVLHVCGANFSIQTGLAKAGLALQISDERVHMAQGSLFASLHNCATGILKTLPADAVLSDEWKQYRDSAYNEIADKGR
jgi:SulP family sulfate permease